MGRTLIEKIIGEHAGRDVRPGEIVDVAIDVRVARDFGGANVVKNLREAGLGIADPARTFFTFDCNPGGSDQKYAANQHLCRQFARETGIRVYDVDAGIGTHVAIDEGLVGPGDSFVSTDSHANILGAIGAFGQGMGDQDIAHAFAYGKVWFRVPPTIRIDLKGRPGPDATPKDVTLELVTRFGANGLLGYAAELYGEYVDDLDLAGRVTLASMCTEAGGIILFLPPNEAVVAHCRRATGRAVQPVYADADAEYAQCVAVEIDGLEPLIARPGHPDDAVPVSEVADMRVDSVFIGSCTNGRYEDLAAAAAVLRGRRIAPHVVLKVVPATDAIWRRLLNDGLLRVFKDAGALVSSAGCGGCASGQVGQNGPGEVTVSTGNRNFPGKQGGGMVLLASPETAAASAIAGCVASVGMLSAIAAREGVSTGGGVSIGGSAACREAAANEGAERRQARSAGASPHAAGSDDRGAAGRPAAGAVRPTRVKGRAWVIRQDNVDTDMIYHNRYLAVTDVAEMGKYALDNLEGWEDFAGSCRPGDVVIAGANFGCGSSRQQAVDCFQSLGVAVLVAESFGAIYERNAINAGLPILCAPAVRSDLQSGEEVEVDLKTGVITRAGGQTIQGTPMSEVQLAVYQRGGLLARYMETG